MNTQLVLMVTRRCNMTCAHCSVESAPGIPGEPSEAELFSAIRTARTNSMKSIQFTGGEPMLRMRLVLRLMREAKRLGMVSAMTTNGFWGRTPSGALRLMHAMQKAGLGALTISYDRYHAEFQGHEPALNIARAAEELRVLVNINMTRTADDQDLGKLAAPFEGLKCARLRFYDVQPVGRARDFPASVLRGSTEGFCSACERPTLTDDGRVTACNGPSYFQKPGSPLIVGSLHETPLGELLHRHSDDPILETIRTHGPSRLREELRAVPGFENFFRESYSGLCELCLHINSDAKAVAALRSRIDASSQQARRIAVAKVLAGARCAGIRQVGTINSVDSGRVFFRAAFAARSERWTDETAKILGRADLDWSRAAHYLISCGLAHPLLGALEDRELTRWAPDFFVERLRKAALTVSAKELVARQILRQINEALRNLGLQGVLLKGAARLAWNASEKRSGFAPGDIDLYVVPDAAQTLRKHLIEAGFNGKKDARLATPQHLPPVFARGISVEIHTAILHPHWRLPEAEMLAAAMPISGFDSLRALPPEGFLLHTAVHGTSHLFSHGLKLASSLLWALREFPDTDWDQLAGWTNACAAPRAFWSPVRVLSEVLRLPFPPEFLALAPSDARQRKLDLIAHAHLFKTLEAPHEANPFVKHGLQLFLRDSLRSRAAYILNAAREKASLPHRTRHTQMPGLTLPRLDEHFRQACRHWRTYRAAVRRSCAAKM
jgi:MoaA/NifB/PqqE/SkfB family radical SAM enzyme